jgi:tRNA U34 2-thiouridine synthase MnmA/TrmU
LKDQSFFLSQISSELLGRVIFPVGHMHKSEVRKLAKNIGLQKISKKSSSVGICFIGKRKFADFIGSYLPERHGLIMDIESKTILGDHSGIYKFTLGQRIPIGDKVNTLKQPYFVAKKDLTTNVIYVVSIYKIYDRV